MSEEFKERTVVLIKPDAVKRGLSSEILQRLEKAGLKIVAIKMVEVDEELAKKHYPDERIEFLEGMGKKTLDTYEKYGKDANEELGTIDPVEIGRMVNKWNIEFLTSGPVIAVLLEGFHAIENVRAMAGFTIPSMATPGTIRGDFSLDSAAISNSKKRAIRNMMHASGNAEEAKFEAQLWFREDEIHQYKRADEDAMFG